MAKESNVHIRIEKSDLDCIRDKAKTYNLTVSEFIRLAALSTLFVEDPLKADAIYLDSHTWSLMRLEMQREGVNLNQSVKALNRLALRLRKQGELASNDDFIQECKREAKEIDERIKAIQKECQNINTIITSMSNKAHIYRR